MTIDAGQLLRRLASGVRPVETGRAEAPRPPVESQSFDSLLSLVSTGAINSGRAVNVAFEADPEFDADQLERLGDAADVAEAAGVAHALLLVDGRGVALDVGERTLTSEVNAHHSREPLRIEAAIYVAGPDDDLGTGTLPLPGAGVVPPGIGELFGDQTTHDTISHTPGRPSAA